MRNQNILITAKNFIQKWFIHKHEKKYELNTERRLELAGYYLIRRGDIGLHQLDEIGAYVYSRKYGIFEVSSGHHIAAMAIFYAWDNGYDTILDYMKNNRRSKKNPERGITLSEMADEWFYNTPGAAYLSNIGPDKPTVYTKRGMLTKELVAFQNATVINAQG